MISYYLLGATGGETCFNLSFVAHFFIRSPVTDIVGGLDTLFPSGSGFSRARYARAPPPAPIFEGESNLVYSVIV